MLYLYDKAIYLYLFILGPGQDVDLYAQVRYEEVC